MKKTITIDLRTGTMLGPICKVFEILPDLERRGYILNIIQKNWSKNSNNGITFLDGKYIKGDSKYLWDADTHPKDLFENLINPTFENVKIIYKKDTIFSKITNNIPPFFQLRRIDFIDFSLIYCSKVELRRMLQIKVDNFITNTTLVEFIRISLYFFYTIFFRKIKILPESMGFRYKLSETLMTDNLINFIKKAKIENVKYILLSTNFDESGVVESQKDRRRGGALFCENEWESHYKYVMQLDEIALTSRKIKFILASKKAVDWSKHIKSDFIDLRNFEELGFSLSQSIYIAQELSSATLNWPSTYSIWITNCSKITHLTWLDNKDTSLWSRNSLHKEDVQCLLKMIGV